MRWGILILVPAVTACSGGGGGSAPEADGDNPSVAAKTSVIPPGDADCPNGGILVETGIDENGNGVLDDNEVDATEKVCNGTQGPAGSDGLNALIDMNPEPAGANCPTGGLRIDVGMDNNANGNLDPDEITQTGFVCNGGDGSVGWQVATLIELDSINPARSPHVAADPNGNVVAVWEQSDGTNSSIYSNRYVPGTGWGEAQPIETYNAGGAWIPQVAMDTNGNAMTVWAQSNDGSVTLTSIWANRYVAGTGWGAAILIGTNDTQSEATPQVAVDGSGNATAVWAQLVGSTRFDIWANRYEVGAGWQGPVLIETNDAGSAINPQVAMDADGNAMVVWQHSDGSLTDIWANRYEVGSGWQGPELIEMNNAGNADNPQVAMDADGNAIVVWQHYDGMRNNIWANRYEVGSGWQGPELIETNDAGSADNPQVAMDANGNAMVVWQHYDGTRYNIWANRYEVGAGWQGPQLIETNNSGWARLPQVAMGANGNAIAVWQQFDGMRNNIWANRYIPGFGWGTAQLIETDNAGSANSPQVTVDGSGNAVAVWEQHDGTTWNVWANRWQAP